MGMDKEISGYERSALEEIARDCLCFRVRKTARAVTQWYDSYLQPTGLRSTQFNLLVAIGLAQAVPVSRLAEVLVMDRTTLTRNLKPLESQGLVRIEPGEDRRVRVISITDRGLQVLQEALPQWRKAQEQIRLSLGESGWDSLHAVLQDLMDKVPSS